MEIGRSTRMKNAIDDTGKEYDPDKSLVILRYDNII